MQATKAKIEAACLEISMPLEAAKSRLEPVREYIALSSIWQTLRDEADDTELCVKVTADIRMYLHDDIYAKVEEFESRLTAQGLNIVDVRLYAFDEDRELYEFSIVVENYIF